MAVFALVQSRAFRSAAAATSHAVVFPLTPTNTNTIILTVVSNATVATPTGYSLASSGINSTGTYIFYKIAGASESSTITLVPSSSADVAVRAYEFSGLATSAVFDKQVASTSNTTTAQASGSTATLSQANELCVAVYGYPHSAYDSIPSAWSSSFIPEGALFGSGTDLPCNATAMKRVTATTAVSVTATVPAAATGNSICLATFKMDAGTTTFTGKPANYVDMLGHFECGQSAGTVVTNTILASCFSGAFSNGWITISDPDLQTAGATPGLTIETGAFHAQDDDLLVEGVPFLNATGGTRGMRATGSANNCIQLSVGEAADLSFGMHFRWHGAQIDSSPRDVVALRSDPSGNYQFIQVWDGVQPVIHVHWQPTSGTGIGPDINISKDNWYWVQLTHVGSGGTATLSVYDAQNGYTLVGTSSGAVTGTESRGVTTIQVGQIKYFAGSSQWFDFRNITVSLDGRTPVTPSSPSTTGTGASTQAANTTSGSGTVSISGSGASTQAKNTTAGSGTTGISGSGADTQAKNTTTASGTLGISGSSAITELKDTSAGTGTVAISGSSAVTELKDTTAGTGAVGISGSGASTQAKNTSAGTATAGVSGSGASTQAPNTTAGTGTLGISGSSAITEVKDTTAGTGTVAISGSGASTQAPNTTTGSGIVGNAASGSGASTQVPNTTVGSGTVGISGSGAATDTTDSTTGTGTVAISGSGASTQQPNTTAGSGVVGNVVSGAGASTQAPNTTAASGTVAISGSGASTQALNATAGSGTVGVSGSGASTEVKDTTAGSGTVAISGSGASTQAPNTTVGSGAIGNVASGSGASTQAPNTTAGSGAVGISGAGAATSTRGTTLGTGMVGITGFGASTQQRNVSNGHGDSYDPNIILKAGKRRVRVPKPTMSVFDKGRTVIRVPLEE